MCLELLYMGCSACFGVRSQLLSPKRIVSLPSLSKTERTFSSLLKDPTGSLGGRYQARTRKDLLFGGSTSMQMNSKSSVGISRRRLYLIESLIYMETPPPLHVLSRRSCCYPATLVSSFGNSGSSLVSFKARM